MRSAEPPMKWLLSAGLHPCRHGHRRMHGRRWLRGRGPGLLLMVARDRAPPLLELLGYGAERMPPASRRRSLLTSDASICKGAN